MAPVSVSTEFHCMAAFLVQTEDGTSGISIQPAQIEHYAEPEGKKAASKYFHDIILNYPTMVK